MLFGFAGYAGVIAYCHVRRLQYFIISAVLISKPAQIYENKCHQHLQSDWSKLDYVSNINAWMPYCDSSQIAAGPSAGGNAFS